MCRRRSKGGQEGQALGRSRGGFTTEKSTQNRTTSGDIIAFDLTGGEASDGRYFDILPISGRHSAPRRHLSTRLRQQGQS